MLNKKWKNILLTLHIILANILLGSILIITFLQLFKSEHFTLSDYQFITKIIFIINENTALAITITGLLFSTITKWGFINFNWIIVNLQKVSV